MAAEIPMRFRVSWASVGISAVIALVTVLISVWIPAKRATRVTALEAIRQNQDIHSRGKDVRVSRLTGRLFGLEESWPRSTSGAAAGATGLPLCPWC